MQRSDRQRFHMDSNRRQHHYIPFKRRNHADADGKTVSIVGTDGTTYVEGDSDYTITVGSYQDSADTSASTTVDDWSSYEVERPESL